MTLLLLLALAYDATLVAVCLYALTYGGGPERWGALINIAGTIASTGARMLFNPHWSVYQFETLVVDAFVLAAFWILALSARRFWPIWSAGFALADVALLASRPLIAHVDFFAYATGSVMWAYFALASLLMGTLRAKAAREKADAPGSGGKPGAAH